MSDLILLSLTQMRRIEPFFPRSRGLPRVDDRRVIFGIIYVIPTRAAMKGRSARLRAAKDAV
jgi:transposase